MVRYVIALLLLIIFSLVAVLVVRDDPGFVMVRYKDFTVETTLAFALVALIVSVVVLFYCFKLLRGFWRLPGVMSRQSRNRRIDKSRRQLSQGLIDLAEGRFGQAEKNLVRMVDFSDSPLLHYLAAARAAQLQGKYDERDNYLMAAHEANPDAEVAIGVTQAELQLAHAQNEQALATLTHLHSVAPKHDYVLMLLARVYTVLDDWTSLVGIMPEVSRKKLFKPEQLHEMELAAYGGMLERAAAQGQGAFDQAWSKVPKALQTDAAMMHSYLGVMADNRWYSGSAEQMIAKSLDRQWDDAMIEVYGRFESKDANAQLARAEKWLQEYGQNESLLLALGRIAIRARLWGKAQGYFEASMGARATPAAALALAELYDQHLQQSDKAAEFYQKGLKLSLTHEQGSQLALEHKQEAALSLDH